MDIEVIYFDLDGTIYPHGNGMWDQIAANMEAYIHQKFGIPKEEIPALRKKFFIEYGTTLRGLQANFTIDSEDYLKFVHDIPVNQFLQPDNNLRTILSRLPQPKYILTNSDKAHTKRVLSALGIDDLFVDILGVIEMDYIPKPDLYVYQYALAAAGNPPPNKCLFADDLPKNLTPAKQLGFTTVLVGDYERKMGADHLIKTLHDIPKAMPDLFTNEPGG